MSFNFSQTAGTSGITIITVSATSREELTDLTKFYTLANVVTEVNMPISQRAYEPLEKYINFQPSAITWSNSGGTANITITSNDEWYIVADEWIQLTRLSDMTEEPQTLSGSGNSVIGIRCYENVGSARTGGISGYCVSNSAISATTTVQQSGGYEKPYLYLSQYQYPVEASGYTGCSVSVYSNLDWTTISDARWIVVNTVSGSNDGTLLFDVQHSEQIVDRIGTITVSSTTESISVDLNVLQSATTLDPYLYVTPTTNIVPMSGGELTLSVSSNTSWETSIQYSGDSRSWISLSDLNGDGDMDVTVRVEQYNGLPNGRSSIISFLNDLYGLKIDVFIRQKDVNTTELFYTSTGGTIITVPTTGWGANVVSNTYENGQGIITFNGDVTSIPYKAFSGTPLETIILPDSIVTINSRAFWGCIDLLPFELPNGLKTISGTVFTNCTSLTSLTIPDSVEYIGDYAFNSNGTTSSGVSISNNNHLTYIGATNFKNSVVLNGTLELGNYGEGVTIIGGAYNDEGAFVNCKGITTLIIRGDNSSCHGGFNGCENLNTIYSYIYDGGRLSGFLSVAPIGTLHYPVDSYRYLTYTKNHFPSGWTFIADL